MTNSPSESLRNRPFHPKSFSLQEAALVTGALPGLEDTSCIIKSKSKRNNTVHDLLLTLTNRLDTATVSIPSPHPAADTAQKSCDCTQKHSSRARLLKGQRNAQRPFSMKQIMSSDIPEVLPSQLANMRPRGGTMD